MHLTLLTYRGSVIKVTDVSHITNFPQIPTNAVQQGQGATARDIINASGASRRTVIDVLKTLVDRGLLVERRERGPTDRGQRERTVYYPAGAIASIGATPGDHTSDESDRTESADVDELLGDDVDELRHTDFSDVLADASPNKIERIESAIPDVNESDSET